MQLLLDLLMTLFEFLVEVVRHALKLLLNGGGLSSNYPYNFLLSFLFDVQVKVAKFCVHCVSDVFKACI